MSGREWQPGDRAMVRCSDGEERPATCEPHPNYADALVWRFPDRVYRDVENSEARPLVEIDPESPVSRDELAMALVEAMHRGGYIADASRGLHPRVVGDALRELANPTPPKPEEPTGLGAVVEDAEGIRFTRVNRRPEHMPYHWHSRDGAYRWDEISPVRVLSEGVPNA